MNAAHPDSSAGSRRKRLSWALLPILAAVVVVADQWTKGLIEARLAPGEMFAPFPALEPWFKLVHWTNTGAAFGLFQGLGPLFAAIAFVVIIAVLILSGQLPEDNLGIRLCLGLQLGGAAGNLIDRLQVGHVTDFLLFSLPVGDRVYSWPAWNIADGCLVVGTILLGILLVWVEGRKPAASAGAEAAPQPNER